MVTKSERGELTRARARVVGAKLFAEKGYRETTTRDLAAAMNVTNGTFYYYFDSKEDLLYQISLEALSDVTAAVTSALDGEVDAEARIKTMIAAHMRTILGSPNSHKTALEVNWRSLAGEKLEQVIAARRAYEELIQDEMARAQASGLLRLNTEAKVFTLLLLNTMNWTIFWYRPDGELAIDDLIEEILRVFLDGSRASS
jgi:AcrR family transcriptional regulator